MAKFNFNSSPVQVEHFENNAKLLSASSMVSDTAGNLVLYFTGCKMANAQGEAIINGNDMPATDFINDGYCPNYYPMSQSLMLLTDPKNDTLYLSLMTGADVDPIEGAYTYGLYLSKMSQYEVYEKNTLIIADTIYSAHLAACRHANGRDWWIILNKLHTNRYYKILIDPAGVHGPYTQDIGPATSAFSNGWGQAFFSPDGSRYVRVSRYDDLFVFNFDRCSGELSDFQQIDITYNDGVSLSGGAAMSPNSRFVYVFGLRYCHQVDLQDTDPQGSITEVGVWDGTLVDSVWGTYFDESALAPDGKIYGSVPGSNPYLHIIHNPDEKGLACNLEQHALLLPDKVWNTNTMPNMPNYRLGPLAGSGCDTLSTSVSGSDEKPLDWQIVPNPNDGTFTVTLPAVGGPYLLRLFDLTGNLLIERNSAHAGNGERLSVSLPAGAYLLEVGNGGVLLGRRLVIIQ